MATSKVVCRAIAIMTIISVLVPPNRSRAGVIETILSCFGDNGEPLTLRQVASLVDCIDHELYRKGMIGIKAPDVWGQNRMTMYRSEFEKQMAGNLGKFQVILQAAQRRSDTAVLTSATSLANTVAAANTAKASNGHKLPTLPATPTVIIPPATTTQAGLTFSTPGGTLAPPSAGSGSASGGGTGGGSSSSGGADAESPDDQLAAISKRLDLLQSNVLTLPKNIVSLATKEGQPGVGLEPTLRLDEEARYINHLHQLRRINSGDDLTDMAGYGLYLLRMPVSLMPGPDTFKGKGAMVTMEARHELTVDLLENTFRDVAVLDVTYALTQIINEDLHQMLCDECLKQPTPLSKTKALQKLVQAKCRAEQALCKEIEAARRLEAVQAACRDPHSIDPLLEAARQEFTAARAERVKREAELTAAEAAFKTAPDQTLAEAKAMYQQALDAFNCINGQVNAAMNAVKDETLRAKVEKETRAWAKEAREKWINKIAEAKLAYSKALADQPCPQEADDETPRNRGLQRMPNVGGGPNSFSIQELRRILGPATAPAPTDDLEADEHAEGDEVVGPIHPRSFAPSEPAIESRGFPPPPSGGLFVPQPPPVNQNPNEGVGPPPPSEIPNSPPLQSPSSGAQNAGPGRPAATSPATTAANRGLRAPSRMTAHGGGSRRGLKHDEVRLARIPFPRSVVPQTAPSRKVLGTSRLEFLDEAIKQSQEEQGPHDSVTLGLIRGALLDTWTYMRTNTEECALFQRPYIDKLGDLIRRRDYPALIKEREKFLAELVRYRTRFENCRRARSRPRLDCSRCSGLRPAPSIHDHRRSAQGRHADHVPTAGMQLRGCAGSLLLRVPAHARGAGGIQCLRRMQVAPAHLRSRPGGRAAERARRVQPANGTSACPGHRRRHGNREHKERHLVRAAARSGPGDNRSQSHSRRLRRGRDDFRMDVLPARSDSALPEQRETHCRYPPGDGSRSRL